MSKRDGKGVSTWEEDQVATPDPKLLRQSLEGEYRRMGERLTSRMEEALKSKMDEMMEQMREMTMAMSNNTRREGTRPRRQEVIVSDEEDYEVQTIRRRPRREEPRGGRDDNLSSIKMHIPPFKGRSDADAYLEWEKKVELIFDCHNYSEEKKVKLATVEFTDYALVWWEQLIQSRRRYREDPVSTWDEMKRIMRKRFVPSYFYREPHQKLQRLTQGSRSVEEYYKDMKMDELNDKVSDVFMTATNNPRRDGLRTRDIEPSGSEDDEVSNHSMRRRTRREEPRAMRHEHNEKKVTLAHLSPMEVYFEQLKLSKSLHGNLGSEAIKKIECEEANSENNMNKGPMVSDCISKKNKEESAIEKSEKSEKKKSLNAKEREVNSAILGKKAILLVRFREVFLCETNLNFNLPCVFVSLLQNFDEKSKLRGVPQTIQYDRDVEFLNPFGKVLWDDTWRLFKPGDWVYLRKKRFPNKRKSKLDARGNGPFQVLERVNDNEYKIALQGEYNVSASFNVSDLSSIDMDADSRMNLFKE